jgi:peptidyl-prolyl cis-trans isomerase D
MFGTIRKHQNWLWAVIITVIIISFVIFFSPNVKFAGDRATGADTGTIGGKPIPREEYREAYDEARLAHFMRTGGREWPGNDEAAQRALERDAVFRVFLKHKIKEMGIEASDEAVGRLIRDRLGNYPPSEFEQVHLRPQRLTGQDFERFMRREAALQQLLNTAGVSAKLLNPREAEILFRKENEQALTEVGVFAASNYVNKVTVSPAELGKFYTNRMALYRIPERIQVSYIEFPVTNFLAEADKQIAAITNFDARIDEEYYRRGTNAFKGTNDGPLTVDEAKKQIKEDSRKALARREAHRKAAEFGSELETQPQPESVATFEKFAAAKGLPVKVTEPFDNRSTGVETNFPPEFRQRAMTLNTNMAVLFNPIVGENAVYVIALKNRLPSEPPQFEKVQEKVTADYKQQQATELARSAATNFHAAVTNTFQQNKPFAETAKQQNVTLVTPPPFSSSTTTLTNLDERLFRILHQVVFDMKPGDVGNILPTADGALVIHLKQLNPVDEAKVRVELPDFLNRIRMYRQNEAFNRWFGKQIEQAKVAPPQRGVPNLPGAPQGMPAPQRQPPPG